MKFKLFPKHVTLIKKHRNKNYYCLSKVKDVFFHGSCFFLRWKTLGWRKTTKIEHDRTARNPSMQAPWEFPSITQMFLKFLHACSTFCHHRWCVGCVGDHGLLIHWWYCSIYHDFPCIHYDQCISNSYKMTTQYLWIGLLISQKKSDMELNKSRTTSQNAKGIPSGNLNWQWKTWWIVHPFDSVWFLLPSSVN